MSCPPGKYDFSVTPFDKSSYCGTFEQGGSNCKDECCLAQEQYCFDACLSNRDCIQRCLVERGCRHDNNGNNNSDSDGDDTDDNDDGEGDDIAEDGGDATEIIEDILEGLAGLA